MAELGRRGLLLPERLKQGKFVLKFQPTVNFKLTLTIIMTTITVVPVVKKALVYDVKRGSYSVG